MLHSRPRDEVVLILVEDLHWIDAASEEFVAAMVDAIVGTKTLLLLNFRPGLLSPWMQRSHYRQISLAPLESEETVELLRDLLGDDPSLALLSRNIAERAQGNPFFLEELVHSLIERGDFEGNRGAYRLKGGIDIIPLPVTVQAVLSARIDRLAEPSRQILQTAAVIGREVPVAILETGDTLPSAGTCPGALAVAANGVVIRVAAVRAGPPCLSPSAHSGSCLSVIAPPATSRTSRRGRPSDRGSFQKPIGRACGTACLPLGAIGQGACRQHKRTCGLRSGSALTIPVRR